MARGRGGRRGGGGRSRGRAGSQGRSGRSGSTGGGGGGRTGGVGGRRSQGNSSSRRGNRFSGRVSGFNTSGGNFSNVGGRYTSRFSRGDIGNYSGNFSGSSSRHYSKFNTDQHFATATEAAKYDAKIQRKIDAKAEVTKDVKEKDSFLKNVVKSFAWTTNPQFMAMTTLGQKAWDSFKFNRNLSKHLSDPAASFRNPNLTIGQTPDSRIGDTYGLTTKAYSQHSNWNTFSQSQLQPFNTEKSALTGDVSKDLHNARYGWGQKPIADFSNQPQIRSNLSGVKNFGMRSAPVSAGDQAEWMLEQEEDRLAAQGNTALSNFLSTQAAVRAANVAKLGELQTGSTALTDRIAALKAQYGEDVDPSELEKLSTQYQSNLAEGNKALTKFDSDVRSYATEWQQRMATEDYTRGVRANTDPYLSPLQQFGIKARAASAAKRKPVGEDFTLTNLATTDQGTLNI